MEFGAIFPQREIGTDPEAIRDFATAAEEYGYAQIHAYDHILGVNRDTHPDLDGPYDHTDSFHEPFTLFSHLAAITEEIDFVTGILVLPQRETELVAKQAAEVDVLSNGRLKLGVGVGWNAAEYTYLGKEFSTRGSRMNEQLEVLQELWSSDLVTFDGDWHRIRDAGINPLPIQRPIPIWLGGSADAVLRRIATYGTGWIVPSRWKAPDSNLSEFEDLRMTLRQYVESEGRDFDSFTIVGRTTLESDDEDAWIERAREWEQVGASHLALTTMDMGLNSPADHIDLIRRWKSALDESGI